MQSLKRQNGMTAIGWLIVLALIGFFVLLTLRMLPSYLEYYKVVSSLDSLQKETDLSTPADIRKLLDRRFNISYVESIQPKDVDIKAVGPNFRVIADYESRKHIFANVDVVMSFYKEVLVRPH
jgi:DNA-dependent RNA polymerase auxiliary subunit epsilon